MKANTPTLTLIAVLAISFLFVPGANAKIIYNDINPDITKSSTGTTRLDIDDDGMTDMEVNLNIMGLKDVWLTINTPTGTQVAMQDWHSRLFQLYDFIDDTSTWMNDANIPLAYLTSGTVEGPWPGKTNSYLGFQFIKDGNKLFGWMRIEVSENVRSFSIREVAYEDLVEFPIMAGDKTKEVSVNEFRKTINDPAFTIGNRVLQVNNTETEGFSNLYITDISGKTLVRTNIISGTQSINLSMLPAGIYCVNLTGKRKNLSKKVYIN